MPASIWMFGRTGQLAQSLIRLAGQQGMRLAVLGRAEADLAEPNSIRQALVDLPAGATVINAAAYTAVDRAESEPELARAVNSVAPGIMAEICARRDATLIHVSTDYVFDGTSERPYTETDPTGPQSVYGASKLDGETAVLAACAQSLILRTAWVYSPFGNNFVKTMLRVGAERDEVRVVADQRGTPTSALDIAAAILAICARRDSGQSDAGVFHLTGFGEASWADFADAIFDLQQPVWKRRPIVTRIGTTEYPTPARRPASSRLNCDRLAKVYGFRAPHWEDSLARVLRELNDA